MTAPGTVAWVHRYGWALRAITGAQREFGVELDRVLASLDVGVLAAAADRFSATLDQIRSVPPIPGREEGRLFGAALAGWDSACRAWSGLTGPDVDRIGRGLRDWQAGTEAYERLSAVLSTGSPGPTDAARRPIDAARRPADPPAAPTVPSAAADGATVVNLAGETRRVSWPGFALAAFFGVAAWVPVVSGLVSGRRPPVAALVVLAVLGTALLGTVVVLGVAMLRLRRATDVLRVDAAGIARTGEFLRFAVPWSAVRGVGIRIAETYPGETWQGPGRRRGSAVAVEFRPVDPAGFARLYPVLATGPAHQRFAATGEGYGCVLGTVRGSTRRRVITAVQRAAPDRWLGVRDATRR